jgi:hypothetical protein
VIISEFPEVFGKFRGEHFLLLWRAVATVSVVELELKLEMELPMALRSRSIEGHVT